MAKAAQKKRPPATAAPSTLRLLAWAVHLYTAMGLVLAGMMAVLIVRGTPADFRWAFIAMAAACIVDGTDGTLARAVRIKQMLPQFDGARLDDITDFLTYTFLPLLLVWRAGILPSSVAWVLVVPLVASAYGFCQVNAKTSDGFFVGFPSYWNIVALYLYVMRWPAAVSVSLLVVLAVLTFVPTRYLYPSQRGLLNRIALVIVASWGCLVAWIVYHLPTTAAGLADPAFAALQRLTLLSLVVPAGYMLASWWISIQRARHVAS